MARLDSYGYNSASVNRYGYIDYGMYGSDWQYGLNFEPSISSFTVANYPTVVDSTPEFLWTSSDAQSDTLTYQLQLNLNINNFDSPTRDTGSTDPFSAPSDRYILAPEFTLATEGTYYARIRAYDGAVWGDWSDVLTFTFSFVSAYPPTLNQVTSPADAFWQTISGTKAPDNYVFVRNNGIEWLQAAFPNGVSGTTWQINIPLTSGDNVLEVVSAVTTSIYGALSAPLTATIHLIVSTPEVFNVWNCFDEFGLILSLPRIPAETNADYKDRLLDVYTNPANSTYSGLRYGIARELGITYTDISIDELSDLAASGYSGNLLNDDNSAIGTKLEDYADEVYTHNPVFLGNIISDESYWDSIDEEGDTGYSFLPHLWDPSSSGIHEKWQGGGIGDNDDLRVTQPKAHWEVGISGWSWYLHIHSGYFYSVYPSGTILV